LGRLCHADFICRIYGLSRLDRLEITNEKEEIVILYALVAGSSLVYAARWL
jgi:hypothetical protein